MCNDSYTHALLWILFFWPTPPPCFFLYPPSAPCMSEPPCGEPAISHASHDVSLVQWTNLFASRHKGHKFKSPGGYLCETGILLLALSRYNPFFYLLGDPFFGDRGVNVHPLSSEVSDQLPTPCSLTLSHPLPAAPPCSCYMFTETTSQHQLHYPIQLQTDYYLQLMEKSSNLYWSHVH